MVKGRMNRGFITFNPQNLPFWIQRKKNLLLYIGIDSNIKESLNSFVMLEKGSEAPIFLQSTMCENHCLLYEEFTCRMYV